MNKKKNHDRAPDKVGFSVALPKALVWQIEEIAETEHRSRNGQIEHFLADAVAQWKRENPQELSHLAEERAPYNATAPDPAGDALRARAAQSTPPPIAPPPTPPAQAKGKL